jgi:tRNA (cmo5U34)-methyltransferase
MTDKPPALGLYDDPQMAARYDRTGGFAPRHKEKLFDVVCNLLVAATPPRSTLLELGAGTGLFTRRAIATRHFGRILVTDGAPSMLDVARAKLSGGDIVLQFEIVDLASEWAGRFANSFADSAFDAVTSTIAIHHVQDKRRLFAQVMHMLKPGGMFVFGDHVDGGTPLTHYLVGRERALVRLGRKEDATEARIRRAIAIDDRRQAGEGNRCETVAQYLVYLSACGFEDVDCLWRNFWLAAFVARKPD